jgi:hypothetical protein
MALDFTILWFRLQDCAILPGFFYSLAFMFLAPPALCSVLLIISHNELVLPVPLSTSLDLVSTFLLLNS